MSVEDISVGSNQTIPSRKKLAFRWLAQTCDQFGSFRLAGFEQALGTTIFVVPIDCHPSSSGLTPCNSQKMVILFRAEHPLLPAPQIKAVHSTPRFGICHLFRRQAAMQNAERLQWPFPDRG